jgi:hypothetical protein
MMCLGFFLINFTIIYDDFNEKGGNKVHVNRNGGVGRHSRTKNASA